MYTRVRRGHICFYCKSFLWCTCAHGAWGHYRVVHNLLHAYIGRPYTYIVSFFSGAFYFSLSRQTLPYHDDAMHINVRPIYLVLISLYEPIRVRTVYLSLKCVRFAPPSPFPQTIARSRVMPRRTSLYVQLLW